MSAAKQLPLPGFEFFCLTAKELVRLPRVQLAPGVLAPMIPRKHVPQYVFVQLLALPDGTYKALPKEMTMGLRVPVVAEALDCNKKVIYRLFEAGFLRGHDLTGHALRICPISVAEHLEACSDPEFWTPERRKQYSEARLIHG